MPELPEVETIVRELNKKVTRKKIIALAVTAPKMVNLPVRGLRQRLVGSTIKKVSRRAKMIIMELANRRYILIHLKMTGQLIYRGGKGRIGAVGGHPIVNGLKNLPNSFTRIIIIFADGSVLFFNDLRKFGWARLVDQKHLDGVLAEYGIEPFTAAWTLKNFQAALGRYPRRKIKQLLLDQGVIAGVGNIYADEACFSARIRPMRQTGSLRAAEVTALYRAIPKILHRSISHGGTSADQYVRTDGSQGGFMPYLQVYGRGGQPCKKCKTKITKIQLNGRGTHYCTHCQR
ncbi:bifunctional DNA-formamidopyrimidine glycosylase/DNA-(apurinic or apyrimidinic site) lyase [Candidatus Falkowbacteria bacterium]|nr:bifunctional DNA-formamidopyrimidine glycosylase/DNA-(apurinic or apyrimidinic site) lyase [Candidatus Falkowbacteria bacterium]